VPTNCIVLQFPRCQGRSFCLLATFGATRKRHHEAGHVDKMAPVRGRRPTPASHMMAGECLASWT
jgi:hypothetical protein